MPGQEETLEFIDPRPTQVIANMTDGTTHQRQFVGVNLNTMFSIMKQEYETKTKKIHSYSISNIKDTERDVREEPALICLDTDWSKLDK